MNAYFTASIDGKKRYLANYLSIIDILKADNHQVTSDHIIKSEPTEIQVENSKDRIQFHDRMEKWIKSSDFVVAETSHPSISVGYEISMAISFGKPVLILYSNSTPPSLLVQHKDNLIVCKKYTLKKLPKIISDFIKYSHDASGFRFTFYITREIAAFMDKIAIKEKISKAVYLRSLLQNEIIRQSM